MQCSYSVFINHCLFGAIKSVFFSTVAQASSNQPPSVVNKLTAYEGWNKHDACSCYDSVSYALFYLYSTSMTNPNTWLQTVFSMRMTSNSANGWCQRKLGPKIWRLDLNSTKSEHLPIRNCSIMSHMPSHNGRKIEATTKVPTSKALGNVLNTKPSAKTASPALSIKLVRFCFIWDDILRPFPPTFFSPCTKLFSDRLLIMLFKDPLPAYSALKK